MDHRTETGRGLWSGFSFNSLICNHSLSAVRFIYNFLWSLTFGTSMCQCGWWPCPDSSSRMHQVGLGHRRLLLWSSRDIRADTGCEWHDLNRAPRLLQTDRGVPVFCWGCRVPSGHIITLPQAHSNGLHPPAQNKPYSLSSFLQSHALSARNSLQ